MRTIFFLLFLLLISQTKAQNIVNVNPTEFVKKLATEKNAVLIDVRTDWEYQKGHLKNSKNLDWNGEHFMDGLKAISKDTPLYVYCHSGGRSSEAAQKLAEEGYKSIINMTGGFSAYTKEKLPYEK